MQLEQDLCGQEVWFAPPDGANTTKQQVGVAWRLGRVEQEDETSRVLIVRDIEQADKNEGEEFKLQVDDVFLANPSKQSTEDMSSLKYINEPALLYNLERRAVENAPYTFLGTVLVTINPIKDVGDPKQLLGSTKALNQPHPYGIAERAFQQMSFAARRAAASSAANKMRALGKTQEEKAAGTAMFAAEYQPDQSIIVSGESGSGKSESCKRVLRHLVARTAPKSSQIRDLESDNDLSEAPSSTELSSLEQALLDANPVLEAFGNAVTLSNHNSSRFGKLTKLYFVNDELTRACVDTYLLEKSRVSSHARGERSFHIFYRLLQGLPLEERAAYGLPTNRDVDLSQLFSILQTENVAPWIFQNDQHAFQAMSKGMISIGLGAKEKEQVFRVLIAILHFGNLEFADVAEQKSDVHVVDSFGEVAILCEPKDSARPQSNVQQIAKLLSISADDVRVMLCERTITAAGESLQVQLDYAQAKQARDGLIRALYAALFDWIIARANSHFSRGASATGSSSSTPLEKENLPTRASANITSQRSSSILPKSPEVVETSIGVLDIFGFENFDKNGLEQLLINYANEALQKTFQEQVLIAEANLYRTEGILGDQGIATMPTDASSELKQTAVDLLEGNGGLLKTIEDMSSTPQPSDDKLLQHLHRSFDKHEIYEKPHPRFVNARFVVAHFAGKVHYDVDGFVQTNVDRVPLQVVECLNKSKDEKVIAQLFLGEAESQATKGLGGIQSARLSKRKKRGLCLKFSHEITRLISVLEATNCSFIRCIKPNSALKRGTQDDWIHRAYVSKQMRYLSIPQTAQVLSAGGLPTRIPYAEVMAAYSETLPKDVLENWLRVPGREEDHPAFCRALFFALDIDESLYKFGLTRVFFRTGALSVVESIFSRAALLSGAELERIGKRFSMFHARICWRRCFAKVFSANVFISIFRGAHARTTASTLLASLFKGFTVRRRYLRLRSASISLAAHVRGRRARLAFAPLLEAHREHLRKLQLEAELEAARQAEAARLEEIARLEEEARRVAEAERLEKLAKEAEAAKRLAQQEQRQREEQEAAVAAAAAAAEKEAARKAEEARLKEQLEKQQEEEKRQEEARQDAEVESKEAEKVRAKALEEPKLHGGKPKSQETKDANVESDDEDDQESTYDEELKPLVKPNSKYRSTSSRHSNRHRDISKALHDEENRLYYGISDDGEVTDWEEEDFEQEDGRVSSTVFVNNMAMIISPRMGSLTRRRAVPRVDSRSSVCSADFLVDAKVIHGSSGSRIQELEAELSKMRKMLDNVQSSQQSMLRMMEESQRRERMLLEEHFRLLRHLDTAPSSSAQRRRTPATKQIKQEPAWDWWCLFGRCSKNVE